jgi:hypothetical protein
MTKFPVLPLAPSRNILIALSSGQGIQPWLMGLTEVAYGVMSDKTHGEHNSSAFGCLAPAAMDGRTASTQMTFCLPIDSCARLKDRTVNGRAAGSSEASGRFTEGIPAERPDA